MKTKKVVKAWGLKDDKGIWYANFDYEEVMKIHLDTNQRNELVRVIIKEVTK